MPTSSVVERILLQEGQEGAWIPKSAYCKQGDKVWFAWGNDNAPLIESIDNAGMTIVESIDEMEMVERDIGGGRKVKLPKDGVWVVEGPAQKSDERNANNRYYPREIWEKFIADQNSSAQIAIRERAMLGHLEHPKDGRTDGNEGAMLVIESTLAKTGVVNCKFELLDTPKGLILQEYTRKGVKWGVSSRGNGTVNEKGRVSPDDYVLETWDAVMRPSVAGSNPRVAEGEPEVTTASRTSVTEDTGSAGAALGEEAKRRVTTVVNLCEQSIDDMNPSERQDLSAHLLKAMRSLREHMTNPHPEVQAAVARAFWKVAAIQETGTQTVDEIIEGACREAVGEGDFGSVPDSYASVIETLQRQLESTSGEAEDLRDQLGVAESRCLTANWRVQELSEQLREADETHEQLRTRADMAEHLLAERSTRVASGPVLDAVDEAVEQVAELEPFRSILERCETDAEVFELAETLLPLAMKPSKIEEDVVEPADEPAVELDEEEEDQSRPSLPRGAVVSESDIEGVKEPARPKSRGVKLAEAAIAQQKRS